MINNIQIETDFLTLMDVVSNTPNPQLAIALLNGTYQQPELCDYDKRDEDMNHNGELVIRKLSFIEYNKWTDEVSYLPERKGHYVKMSREKWNKLMAWNDQDY